MNPHMSYRRAVAALLSFAFASILVSCEKRAPNTAPAPKLIVFNAGSLTASFAEMLDEFKRLHPGMTTQQESSGSLEAARKITDLGKQCDVLALADFDVIPALLIPQYAEWCAVFARNQMVLAYTPKSKFSVEPAWIVRLPLTVSVASRAQPAISAPAAPPAP